MCAITRAGITRQAVWQPRHGKCCAESAAVCCHCSTRGRGCRRCSGAGPFHLRCHARGRKRRICAGLQLLCQGGTRRRTCSRSGPVGGRGARVARVVGWPDWCRNRESCTPCVEAFRHEPVRSQFGRTVCTPGSLGVRGLPGAHHGLAPPRSPSTPNLDFPCAAARPHRCCIVRLVPRRSAWRPVVCRSGLYGAGVGSAIPLSRLPRDFAGPVRSHGGQGAPHRRGSRL